MEFINAIAIDDEPVALAILEKHAVSIPFLKLKACFVSVKEAMEYLLHHPVELVFLDIEMPDRSGLTLAAKLIPDRQVIFTTAYADYAPQGFDVAATDYLLKPIKQERFRLACQRAFDQLKLQKTDTAELGRHIFIKSGYELVRIDLADIVYIQAADNYIVLYAPGKQTISRTSMTAIARSLPDNFLRVHKSFIVALQYIDRVEGDKIFIASKEISISKAYKQAFKQRFLALNHH